MGFGGKVNNFFTSLLVAISNIISLFIAPLMASYILFLMRASPQWSEHTAYKPSIIKSALALH
jgi:hypothetical protein